MPWPRAVTAQRRPCSLRLVSPTAWQTQPAGPASQEPTTRTGSVCSAGATHLQPQLAPTPQSLSSGRARSTIPAPRHGSAKATASVELLLTAVGSRFLKPAHPSRQHANQAASHAQSRVSRTRVVARRSRAQAHALTHTVSLSLAHGN
jgi:hypothetical protein